MSKIFYSFYITLIISVAIKICSVTYIIEKFSNNKYKPTWESLDSRPLPKWYDEAKIGIFLHWGIFSVPSFGSEWFWFNWQTSKTKSYVDFMKNNYPPSMTYQDFAKDFTAEFFNPNEWAELFKKSGAKYVVLTSKHHEGYTLWPSKYSFGSNSQDVGPHRDLIRDLAESIRNKNMTFGLYHSLFEWYNPMYLWDRIASKQDFVRNKIIPELYELVYNYDPAIIWSDGDSVALDTYWNSTQFLAWLYNDSPVKDTVVTNDRWGKGTSCKHGGFYSCKDRYNPGVIQKHKWENAMTIDKYSWGFRRNAKLSDYMTTYEIIKTLAQTISCGGNMLINVGPTKDGIIAPIFQERLLDLGKWLSVNGEAIYASKPWTSQNDSKTADIWYTSKATYVYAIVLNWPKQNTLNLSSVTKLFQNPKVVVNLLGFGDKLKWNLNGEQVMIKFPDKATLSYEWAWVLKIPRLSRNL